MALTAIQSVLAQTNRNFNFIVSDNSSDNCVERILKDNFPSVHFVRRGSDISIYDHWNLCLSECDSTYVMLFHDDDEMLPHMIDTFWKHEKSFNEFTGLAFNARILRNNESHRSAFQARKQIEGPFTSSEILARYFFKFSCGIAPFPGYIYRTSAIKQLRFSADFGKYGDVRLLIELASLGNIFWISQPQFRYRVHGENDGLKESRSDRVRFLTYLKREYGNQNLKFRLSDYRYFFYRKCFSQQQLQNRRFLLPIRRFNLIYRLKRIFRIEYYCRFIIKHFGTTSLR